MQFYTRYNNKTTILYALIDYYNNLFFYYIEINNYNTSTYNTTLVHAYNNILLYYDDDVDLTWLNSVVIHMVRTRENIVI